jgi:Kdo2-lipid IVA lauroyltransferase/acyltransferase
MTLLGRAFSLTLRVGRILSPALAWRLGGALGHAYGLLPGRDQRRCREHLAQAFPQREPLWVERTARATFRHFGRMALWTLSTLQRHPRALLSDVVIEGREHLAATMAGCRRGEGTLIISGHLGNWELLARTTGSLLPVSVVGKRMRNAEFEAVIEHVRTSSGNRMIDQDDGMRRCLSELREGRLLACLIDQDIPRLPGVFVPWFGRAARTPSGPAALAVLGRCAIQPVFAFFKAGRWVLHWGPRQHFPTCGNRSADIATITAWVTEYFEAVVRRHPEQWVWWHKRWRTRPEGEKQEAGSGKLEAGS